MSLHWIQQHKEILTLTLKTLKTVFKEMSNSLTLASSNVVNCEYGDSFFFSGDKRGPSIDFMGTCTLWRISIGSSWPLCRTGCPRRTPSKEGSPVSWKPVWFCLPGPRRDLLKPSDLQRIWNRQLPRHPATPSEQFSRRAVDGDVAPRTSAEAAAGGSVQLRPAEAQLWILF